MTKRRSLKDLIDHDYAAGYAEIRELVDFTSTPEVREKMSASEQAVIRFCELLLVGLVEGAGECVDRGDLDPVEVMVLAWKAIGIALACLNVQGFSEANGRVRQEMLHTITAAYKDTVRMHYARQEKG